MKGSVSLYSHKLVVRALLISYRRKKLTDKNYSQLLEPFIKSCEELNTKLQLNST